MNLLNSFQANKQVRAGTVFSTNFSFYSFRKKAGKRTSLFFAFKLASKIAPQSKCLVAGAK